MRISKYLKFIEDAKLYFKDDKAIFGLDWTQ